MKPNPGRGPAKSWSLPATPEYATGNSQEALLKKEGEEK
jgi:hypothetical protein